MLHDTETDSRRLDPASCSVEELCQCLSTDPAHGLSHKEAERRLEKERRIPLFGTTEKPFKAHLKNAFREPSLWLLLAVSVISLFFDRVAVGLACLALAGVHGLACAWMAYFADRTDAGLQAYDAPLSRVIRNGRGIFRISGNRVVKGDILILHPGDVVPADVRLIFSEGLVVTEHRMGGDRNDVQILRLEKNAAAVPERITCEHSPENMIFAGAVVEEGSARAVVVAVGDKTHLGAMNGSLSPAHTNRTPLSLTKARKYIALWNLIAVVIIVPVTAIGIFALGHRFDLLDLFLTSLAFATVSLTEHLTARGLYMGTRMRASAAHHRDVGQSVDIKTSRSLEQLGEMTHLVLVGTAGLHDGQLHPTSVMIGSQSYDVGQAEEDPALRRLSGLLHLWKTGVELHNGSARESAAPVFLAVDDVHDWIEPDAAALSVQTEALAERWGEVAVKLRGQAPMYLRITSDFSEAEACSCVASAEGKIAFDGTAKYEWYRAYGRALKNGSRVYFLISEEGEHACAEAMLMTSIRVCRKTKGCIDDLEDAGITVTAFLHDISDENTRVLEACGLTERMPAARPAENGGRPDAIHLVRDGVRAFEGCDQEYVEDYIEAVRAEGGRVGVLAVEREDVPLLYHADVAMTCAPRLYDTYAKHNAELCQEEDVSDGNPDSLRGSDLARRCAHVILRRSNVHGGGLCAVRHALLTATRFRRGLEGACRFLLVSEIMRLVAVLLPVVTGVTLLPAVAVLLSGLVVDMAVVVCYAYADLPPTPDDPIEGGAPLCLTQPHVTLRREWIAAGIAALLPWVVAGITRAIGGSMAPSMLYFAVMTLTAGQLALFLTGQPPRRSRLTFITAMLMVCIYVGALAAGLGAGLDILWCLAWPLLQPAVYFVARGFFALKDRMARRGEEA